MQLDGVRYNLGMHATEIDAARAYDKFAGVRPTSTTNETSDLIVTTTSITIQEHNKKTNFPYPAKQGPPSHEPTASTGESNNQVGVGSLCNRKVEFPVAFTHSHNSRMNPQGGNSWPGGTSTITTNVQPFDQTTQPFAGPTSYGNAYNNANNLGDQCILQHYTQFNRSFDHQPQQWAQELPPPPNHHCWQHQSYLQQQQLMYQQQLHDPYLMQIHAAQDSQLVVYVPVPLPIAEAVTKYVHEFHVFEQQQRHQQHRHTLQPQHPHNMHMPNSTLHLAPIVTEQTTPTPLSLFPATGIVPAPVQIQAPVPVIDTGVPSLQHSELTVSVNSPTPSIPEP